jgi:hypothetical protein
VLEQPSPGRNAGQSPGRRNIVLLHGSELNRTHNTGKRTANRAPPQAAQRHHRA